MKNFKWEGNIMGKHLVLWSLIESNVPIDPKERGAGWGLLMAMVRQDIEKGVSKDWGAFLGELNGYAIAEGSLREGMKVVMADIEEAALLQAEAELNANGGEVMAVLTDVTKIDDLKMLAKKTLDKYGQIHILCNNAGVGYYMNSTTFSWESPLADWKWILDVNLWGVINGLHIFVPIMLKQDIECHIVNMASIAGLSAPTLGACIYGVSKHAVVAISEGLRNEFNQIGSKLKVSVMCPGWVNTNLIKSERNRPKELDFKVEPNKDFEPILKGFHNAVKTGTSPEKVSESLFKALRNDIFYILPHTGLAWKKLVTNRLDEIFETFKENKAIQKKKKSE